MDWGNDDIAEEPKPAEAAERELVPEGLHDFRIKEVLEDDARVELRLVHDDKRFGWVFCRLPKDADWARRIASSLRKSLGIAADDWAAMQAGDLAGRRVAAEIYHRIGKTGGTFVNVRKFVAVERAEPKPAAARSQTAKAAAAFKAAATSGDDIPF
jgi:hypothetical protein